MKKFIFAAMIAATALAASAKELKTVIFTTTPQMHCNACEVRIKNNLKYEKGVKSIETNVEEQKVTVTYDADKTSEEKLQKAFEKFKYTARIVEPGEKVGANAGEECDQM